MTALGWCDRTDLRRQLAASERLWPAEAWRVRTAILLSCGDPAVEILFLVPNVDAEAERLRQAGVELLSGPVDRAWGHRTLHLLDPDAHVVELAQEIPRTGPRVRPDQS